jgi:NAD(P)-dependent dehydrogenase (short-subunit alcohol dehydrogenase family)
MAGSDFKGRIALVTGASRGIGRAVSVALAKAGAHVVAVARDVGRLEELDDAIRKEGGSATLVPMDMKDFAAIDRAGQAIFQRWGKLDALFGNAAILGPLTPLTHLQPSVWSDVMQINLSANWRLIRVFDPLLRLSDSGRALFVSSAVAHGARPFWGAYAVSKAALEAMVRTYASELAGTAIRANLLNPGPTRTGMRAAAMPGEDPMTLPAPEELTPLILELLSSDCDDNGELFTFKRAAAPA